MASVKDIKGKQSGPELCEYQFKADYRAAKGNLEKKEKPSYRDFYKDQVVIGYEYDKSLSKEAIPDVVIVLYEQNCWVVRKEKLFTLGKVKEEDMKKYDKRYLGAQMQEELDKASSKNLVKEVVDNSRTSVKGALLGMFAGIVIGLITKRSLLVFGSLGTIAGGYVGSKFKSDKKDNEKLKIKE